MKVVQQSLIEYIQRLLQKGYDAGTIRSTLLNAGYSPYDVDVALRVAGKPKRKIGTQMLVIVFLVLFVLVGGTLITMKLMQPSAAELSLSLTLFSDRVALGQDVIVNADIENLGGPTSGLIDFAIVGPGGRVVSLTESFSVDTRVSIPGTLSLPETAAQGSYTLMATLSYDGPLVSRQVVFDVVETAPEVELPAQVLEEKTTVKAKKAQLTCPGGCDDLNFCTTDVCSQGECAYTPIVPCCGNLQCESGESISSCPLDCGERPVDPSDVSAEAVEQASSDITVAIGLCDSLAQRAYIDSCLNEISGAAENKAPCASIIDDDLRDTCYMKFAFENDFSVCPEISNPYVKNSCQSLASLAQISAQAP